MEHTQVTSAIIKKSVAVRTCSIHWLNLEQHYQLCLNKTNWNPLSIRKQIYKSENDSSSMGFFYSCIALWDKFPPRPWWLHIFQELRAILFLFIVASPSQPKTRTEIAVLWPTSLQPEWTVPSRSALMLCRRSQLVWLERISLLCQESWNENQTGASLEFLFCLFPKVEVTHLNTYHEWLYLTTIRSWSTRLIPGRATLFI